MHCLETNSLSPQKRPNSGSIEAFSTFQSLSEFIQEYDHMIKQSVLRWPAKLALGAGVSLSLATTLAAQDVTLSSLDGELTLRG